MTSASTSKYRSRAIANNVIAFSISYQRENMLARGMGLEHLRELLIRLARPILRQVRASRMEATGKTLRTTSSSLCFV